jgi:hypothetical protein
LYVSRHVVFLEHIPFFSLSSDTHTPSRSELTNIDPFGVDNDISSDCNFENCRDGTSAAPDTYAPFVPSATQQPPATVVSTAPPPPPPSPTPPPSRYPSRDRKSTQLPDFVYSIYSPSFASFLTSVHSLSEPSSYKEAIVNTFGTSNESLDADDFYLYVHTSETGVDSIKFALRSDVGELNANGTLVGDGFAKTYSYTPNGTFTSSAPTEGCRLQFDTQGRITTVSIPQYDTENKIIGYRDVELTAKTTTDEKAYQDAYNQYEYKQYEYDKAQQDVNRKTEIIQQEDRNLELKLQRLDNERTQITTELDAVEKVINDNIESSYKTFSG